MSDYDLLCKLMDQLAGEMLDLIVIGLWYAAFCGIRIGDCFDVKLDDYLTRSKQ